MFENASFYEAPAYYLEFKNREHVRFTIIYRVPPVSFLMYGC